MPLPSDAGSSRPQARVVVSGHRCKGRRFRTTRPARLALLRACNIIYTPGRGGVRRRGAPRRGPLRNRDRAHHAGRLRLPVVQGARRRRAGRDAARPVVLRALHRPPRTRWSSRTRTRDRALRRQPAGRRGPEHPLLRGRAPARGGRLGDRRSLGGRSNSAHADRAAARARSSASPGRSSRELRLRRDLGRDPRARRDATRASAPARSSAAAGRSCATLGRGAIGAVFEAHDARRRARGDQGAPPRVAHATRRSSSASPGRRACSCA